MEIIQNRLKQVLDSFDFTDIETAESFAQFFLRNRHLIARKSFKEEYGEEEEKYYKNFADFMRLFFNKLFIRFLARELNLFSLNEINSLEERILIEPTKEGWYNFPDDLFPGLEKSFKKTPMEISTAIQNAEREANSLQQDADAYVKENELLSRTEWSDYFYDLNHARGSYSMNRQITTEVRHYTKSL